MALSTEQLDAYLQLLKDAGVERFECDEFSVRFAPPAPVFEQFPEQIPEAQGSGIPERRSLFQDPNLWPGGQPPTFFTKAK